MTLLIRSVRVLGASTEQTDALDVFVTGDKISAIGNFSGKKADEIIDGQGAYLSPGFIDVNTDSDHYLSIFSDPEQGDFLRQGVTTTVAGNCGSSLAPLLYGSLESIQKWTDISKINVDWHSMREFLDLLERRKPLGVNFATLIGHATVRRAIAGDHLRDLTKNELVVFGETVRRALSEGGWGLSTGLGYVHGREAPYQEIKYLAGIVQEHEGIYATHIRGGHDEIETGVLEAIRIARETKVKVMISHLLPIREHEAHYERAISSITNLPSEINLNFDLYPFDVSVLALYTFLPGWAQNGGRDVMVSNLKDKWLASRILADLPRVSDPYEFLIVQAPGNESLIGKTLKDIMNLYLYRDSREALLKLMTMTDLRASVFHKNINRDIAIQTLRNPRAFVSSNAASVLDEPHVKKPERARATFSKFLDLVERDGIMPIHEAVRRITKDPARKFGFLGRGEVREGNFADLVIFRGGDIKYTIVNGKIAYKNGSLMNVRAGKILRRKAR